MVPKPVAVRVEEDVGAIDKCLVLGGVRRCEWALHFGNNRARGGVDGAPDELDEVAVVNAITTDAVQSATALSRLVPSASAGVGLQSLLRMVGFEAQAGLDAIDHPDNSLDVHPTFVLLPPPPPPPPLPPPRRVTLWEPRRAAPDVAVATGKRRRPPQRTTPAPVATHRQTVTTGR